MGLLFGVIGLELIGIFILAFSWWQHSQLLSLQNTDLIIFISIVMSMALAPALTVLAMILETHAKPSMKPLILGCIAIAIRLAILTLPNAVNRLEWTSEILEKKRIDVVVGLIFTSIWFTLVAIKHRQFSKNSRQHEAKQ